VHDPALGEEPELVDAAARALLLSLESARPQSELDRTVDELRRSRRRLAVATSEERRRLERDLHDTAQQQLVALRVAIELTRERAEANTAVAERLAEVARELDDAIAEVRTVAGGIYPPSLASGGLAAALAEAARESDRPVEVDVAGLGRYPADIEAIVYFCCAEALRNAAAHAGATARIRLWAREQPASLGFEIADDGVGFDGATDRGGGLTTAADRIAAIDGTLEVVSAPGRGTTVCGSVPLHR
jgi:signal transduction histidine kinase